MNRKFGLLLTAAVELLRDPALRRISFSCAVCLFASGVAPLSGVRALAGNAEGVTRVSARSQTYWVEELAEGLSFPSSMAWLPSGDILITERMGGVRIIRDGKLDPKHVRGAPVSYQGLLDGLRDILLDPDFQTNHLLYILISEGTFDLRHAAVYRARYSTAGLEDVERIFRVLDDVGGYAQVATRMIFLADKTLLLGIPEDHLERAQQLGSHRGKILRINRDGSVPADNPFLNTAGALPEIWSYGHRAPLGLFQDSDTGLIWEVESGPQGGDELNVLKAGRNYGWAKASWGFSYSNNGLDAPLQSAPGIEDPILVWTPSATPSGLVRYRGNIYPRWDGDYFVGHLTAKALVSLRIDGLQVVLQEKMLLDLEERIRDVKVGPDNHLYLLTDHQNGRLLRLQPGHPKANQLARVANKLDQIYDIQSAWDFPRDEEIANVEADVGKGRQAFIERCAVCHSVGAVLRGGELGPDLAGIYGRLMGRKGDFEYSPNMAGAVFVWNFATLNRFLANPSGFVPGTKMTAPPVIDREMRLQIVAFLKQQSPEQR